MTLQISILPEFDTNPIMDHYRNYKNKNQFDAGVDLIVPNDLHLTAGYHMLKFGITCYHEKPLSLVPRSSIAKLPIRMKSTVDVNDIQSTELFAIINCHQDHFVEKGTRLFQLVNHDLTPMTVSVGPTLMPFHHSVKTLELKLKTDNDELKSYYATSSSTSTATIDIILPQEITLTRGVNVIKLDIACEPLEKCGYLLCQHDHDNIKMCNNVGIIDYGYRGILMAKVDYTPSDPEKSQLTLPARMPLFYLTNHAYQSINIQVVNELNTTDRGEGGFGSTGVGI